MTETTGVGTQPTPVTDGQSTQANAADTTAWDAAVQEAVATGVVILGGTILQMINNANQAGQEEG